LVASLPGPVYLTGESLPAFEVDNKVRIIKKRPFSFSSPFAPDLETKQHLMNGLQLNQFSSFIGQLSDVDYAGQQSKDRTSVDV
jgi:hypothetical protein